MQGAALYGWDATNLKWVKLQSNVDGKLIIDPSEILEDNPTNNEVGKAPTSNWAYDHKALPGAHHSNKIIYCYNNYTWLQATLPSVYDIGLSISYVKPDHGWPDYGVVVNLNGKSTAVNYGFGQIFVPIGGDDHTDEWLIRYGDRDLLDWTAWKVLAPDVAGMILTHKNIAAAHHAKYTDLEAQEACKLDGTLYWSCNGVAFTTQNPAVDDISISPYGLCTINADGIRFIVDVNLPHGCTVTSVIVYGGVAGASENYILRRHRLSNNSSVNMASEDINTEDTTISYATIDNSQYAYVLSVSTLDTNDELHGAIIKYTL